MPPFTIHLDLYTFRVITVVNLFIFGMVTLLTSVVNRSVAGVRTCALGFFAIGAGSMGSILHTLISARWIVLCANLLMLPGAILVMQGVLRFRGQRTFSPWKLLAVFPFLLAAFCYFLFVDDRLPVRVMLASPAYGFITFICARAMFTGVEAADRLIYWPSGVAFALHGLVMLWRLGRALGGHYGTHLWAPVDVELAASAATNLAMMTCALSLLTASGLRLRREAEALALYDPLTHLPNRRLFLDRLRQAERRATASGYALGAIFLDLDGFKEVNDTHGHRAGDDLLRGVADRLSGVLTGDETLARVGGDEFVVSLERTESRESLEQLAGRLKAAVETGMVRVSCGCALFPDDAGSAEAMVRAADSAMYRDKRGVTSQTDRRSFAASTKAARAHPQSAPAAGSESH